MKWLFATLVGLNLIVFAGMIASKMLKEYMPAPEPQKVATTQPIIIQQPPTVIAAGGNNLNGNMVAGASTPASGNGNTGDKPKTPVITAKEQPKNSEKNKEGKGTFTITRSDGTSISGSVGSDGSTDQPRVRYKECSARVNMPEDDYHRIKGLLGKYPHAASRQVTENQGEGGGQTSSRMNVLFMSVSDQDASAIQAVVGRYGQLSRTPCNK